MSDPDSELKEAAALQSRTLWTLLAINATMFVVELAAGWIAESTSLLADSLDMLADASVYAIALYAVARSRRLQANAAMTSGALQITLGLAALLEVARRYLIGSDPLSVIMIGIGALALIANVACLILIAKHREGGVHMRASWLFSTNDVLANIGVIISGALVVLFGSHLPDLMIGVLISALVIRGGTQIVREAKAERRQSELGA